MKHEIMMMHAALRTNSRGRIIHPNNHVVMMSREYSSSSSAASTIRRRSSPAVSADADAAAATANRSTRYCILHSSCASSEVMSRAMCHQTKNKRQLSSARKFPSLSSTSQTEKRGRRVWKSLDHNNITIGDELDANDGHGIAAAANNDYWDTAVDNVKDDLHDSLMRICEQERQGSRMKQSQLGVLREDPHEDMRLLLENYTAAALASALRDREDALQHCATLLAQNKLDELSQILRPYEQHLIIQRRYSKERVIDFTTGGFDAHDIELIRKGLNRMPRTVSTAHSRRAGVVLPLCNVDGVPCILFEKRSHRLRAHPDEVCLPGGMVSEGGDRSIVQTCLREMEEEIGIGQNAATVLGVLRCNWGEVHHLVGVAVTPVVCFLGEIGQSQLNLNPEEVAECFSVPLESFLDRDRWVHKKHYAPFFTGGPHIIWGLTGYIVNRFVRDIIERYDVVFDDSNRA